jgi:hypothetical protein
VKQHKSTREKISFVPLPSSSDEIKFLKNLFSGPEINATEATAQSAEIREFIGAKK